jgi:type IV secretory pathway TrbD component
MARWVLWGAFVLVVPLPFYLVETGAVPLARLAMLFGVVAAVIVVEGTAGIAIVAAVLLLVQATAYGLLLWWLARGVTRPLGRSPPRRVATVTAALVATSLLVAASFEIYHTPFRTRSLRTNLLHVFE